MEIRLYGYCGGRQFKSKSKKVKIGEIVKFDLNDCCYIYGYELWKGEKYVGTEKFEKVIDISYNGAIVEFTVQKTCSKCNDLIDNEEKHAKLCSNSSKGHLVCP